MKLAIGFMLCEGDDPKTASAVVTDKDGVEHTLNAETGSCIVDIDPGHGAHIGKPGAAPAKKVAAKTAKK